MEQYMIYALIKRNTNLICLNKEHKVYVNNRRLINCFVGKSLEEN